MAKYNDTRERLVESASKLIYQQGYSYTSLQEIAAGIGVPIGNIYYYYQTKDSLGYCVIQAYADQLNERFSVWEKLKTPQDRLLAVLHHEVKTLGELYQFGCPLMGLIHDFKLSGNQLEAEVVKLIKGLLIWCQRQFELIFANTNTTIPHSKDKARDAAEYFIGTLKGASLVAYSQKDYKTLMIEINHLRDWVKEL